MQRVGVSIADAVSTAPNERMWRANYLSDGGYWMKYRCKKAATWARVACRLGQNWSELQPVVMALAASNLRL